MNDQMNLDFVTELMEEYKVPGVAVGILHEGEVHTAGFGVTNVDHPLPVTDETLFQIGSITKTFTATAMMRLVEMGKLDLEATVRTYLSDFKVADETASAQVTLRDLLTHTGGWDGDLFDDTGPGDDALPRYMDSLADREQVSPVGVHFSYNNAGFSLAGYIIEKVTGKSYQEAVRELVIEPLGLESVCFDPGDAMTYRFAVGHQEDGNDVKVARPWALPRSLYPVGAIICHVKDLLRYARFHLGDGETEEGERLLSPKSMVQMQSPQVSIWGEKQMMGLSWFIDQVSDTHQISHGGGTKGQITLLVLVPEHDFAVAVFTNADLGGHVTRAVSREIMKQYLGLESPEPEPIESTPEELAAYAGRYTRPFADIELGVLAGRLIGQMIFKAGFPTKETPPMPPPPPMTLALYEKDRLLVLDGPSKDMRVDTIRTPEGEIGWLRVGVRLYARET
jgi:CubicO group peptidase (beta-lactamase class C family)